jgi:hypothetical protein
MTQIGDKLVDVDVVPEENLVPDQDRRHIVGFLGQRDHGIDFSVVLSEVLVEPCAGCDGKTMPFRNGRDRHHVSPGAVDAYPPGNSGKQGHVPIYSRRIEPLSLGRIPLQPIRGIADPP